MSRVQHCVIQHSKAMSIWYEVSGLPSFRWVIGLPSSSWAKVCLDPRTQPGTHFLLLGPWWHWPTCTRICLPVYLPPPGLSSLFFWLQRWFRDYMGSNLGQLFRKRSYLPPQEFAWLTELNLEMPVAIFATIWEELAWEWSWFRRNQGQGIPDGSVGIPGSSWAWSLTRPRNFHFYVSN